ncbi:SLC26A/SulP transporter family protein [Denitratisoma oestradiolicum]|uniref:Cyclic nucleotide-binding protein n=1 Tax=Denitratisoma oestradiolicum TaxID=311182 RepID=A0A6S6XS08_9PROT|nr:SulP family inorganic anion transporter [Denitratisoma oestradiolicum]TWO79740.1 cyclic nucleotide-binding protein [Denitratisoma oestradiolicum]CAB1367505.1 Cyclic nucleotide-binding protein [Denitratisoma oestradiolicum]
MRISRPRLENPAGDFWGGLAAMLVALPSAIAFGVTIYSPLGASAAAQGALAGILGATALGLIAPALGGTNRLITAPCAPAAAVLSAFAIESMQGGASPAAVLLMLSMLGLLAGLLQVSFGIARLGRLIEYMPYPVVSGYLSGVGLIIIAAQLPKLLGVPKGVHFWASLAIPAQWQWQGMLVGGLTMGVMLGASRVTQLVPAAILGLLAGVLGYFGLGLFDPTLLTLAGNALVVGPLGEGGGSFADALAGRWAAMGDIGIDQVRHIAIPALTLAVLLSIDTLKTCVVLDALTRSRHQSNRELIGQGLGNVASALVGGIPGAGTMGATLVNISSGAASRFSGVMEGVLSLVAFLVLGSLIAWVPVAALAAILIVIGVRMIDRHSFHFLRQRTTMLDFAVIAAVVTTALTLSLIAASGVGIVLAVVLFIREQIGGTVVRRKVLGNQSFSKRVRTQAEMEILLKQGDRAAIVELQGSLFFGTANQLYTALEPELKTRTYLILDMRRVQTVDVTAAHMLDQVKAMLAERNGYLIFSQIPHNLPSGKDIQQYFDQVGLVQPDSPVRIFDELDEAMEWVEDRIIAEAALDLVEESELALGEIELFRGRKEQTLTAFEQCLEKRSYKAGEHIFAQGDTGDEIFLIRRGAVRILLPLEGKQAHHLGTFGRGAFFGEMAFLDGAPRSADAVAFSDAELYVLSRRTFDKFAEEHKKAALALMEGIASVLASRLRYTNAELRVLES